jgi:hypothetical protein
MEIRLTFACTQDLRVDKILKSTSARIGGTMKRIIAALWLAVLVCTIGATSASATDFKVTSLASGVLKGKQISGLLGEQKFLVEASHEIVCKKATISGLVIALEANAQPAKVTYGECTGAGLSVEVPEAEYEFSAEGKFAIIKEILIKIESIVKCTVKIKPQTELESVTYSPTEKLTKKLEVTVKATKVESEVSGGGGLCGKEGKDTAGRYSGTDEIEIEGAEIETQAETLVPGACVQVGAREGNFKDAGCTMAEVKGNYTTILCRQLAGVHLRPFSDNACSMANLIGPWYETVCVERLPATHKWANNVCNMAAPMNNGAWELFKT